MARETVNLQEQLRKLHPSFDDCPSPCARRYEQGEQPTDLPDFCDLCDVRKQIGFFEQAFHAEMIKRSQDGSRWSFDFLSQAVAKVRRIDAELDGSGYPPGCDALTAQLLDIFRSEEMRPLRIARWKADQIPAGGKE